MINGNTRIANFRLERGCRSASHSVILTRHCRRTSIAKSRQGTNKQTKKKWIQLGVLWEQRKATVRKCRFSINFPSRTITLMDLQCQWMIKHDYFQRSGNILNSLLLRSNKWLIGVYLLCHILSYNVINQPSFYPVVCSHPYLTSFHFLVPALHVSCAPCACFITDETQNAIFVIWCNALALIWHTMHRGTVNKQRTDWGTLCSPPKCDWSSLGFLLNYVIEKIHSRQSKTKLNLFEVENTVLDYCSFTTLGGEKKKIKKTCNW